MINNINDNFEKQLFSMTTIISTEMRKDNLLHSGQATAFFYNEVTPTDPTKKGPQWYKLEKYWLVTNRHVVLPKINKKECLVDKLTFAIRQNINNTIQWKPISITKKELLQLLKLHTNDIIDIAMIDISQYIENILMGIKDKTDSNNYYLPTSLSNTNLPQNQPISIDVTSDIIVASYPKGFYDEYNKFPIVKSGIISSAWGLPFKGLPMFQIDAQLFPGSSGGLVISKPTNIAMINGNLNYNTTKQFVLLGVYSGEFTWDKELEVDGKKIIVKTSYGLGNVWYSYLIPEIIENGKNYTEQNGN